MIDYGTWGICCPPRMGGGWMARAACLGGFTAAPGGDITASPPAGYTGFVVTLVRHPATWLPSFHAARSMPRPAWCQHEDLIAFVEDCCRLLPGKIWETHVGYKAATVIRMEDLPWAGVEFFSSLGVGRAGLDQIRNLRPTNPGPPAYLPSPLRAKVIAAEPEYCEAYQYW